MFKFIKDDIDDVTIELYKKEISKLEIANVKLREENDVLKKHIEETEDFRKQFIDGIEKNKELNLKMKEEFNELIKIKNELKAQISDLNKNVGQE